MEYSLLGEICALFDGASGKICPVTASRSATLPSSEVKIQNAVRTNTAGELDVTFELTHSFREITEADADEAVRYICRLCKAAEATGRARLVSLDGVVHNSDGVSASCRAVFRYTAHVSSVKLKLGDSDASRYVLDANVSVREILSERRYIEHASPVRERLGEDVTVTFYIDSAGTAAFHAAFANGACRVECSVGSLKIDGEFVLSSLDVSDGAKCIVRSSGRVSLSSKGGSTDEENIDDGRGE